MPIYYIYTTQSAKSVKIKNILDKYVKYYPLLKCMCYETLYSEFRERIRAPTQNVDDLNSQIDDILRTEYFPPDVECRIPVLICKTSNNHDVYYMHGEITIMDVINDLNLEIPVNNKPQEDVVPRNTRVPPQQIKEPDTKKSDQHTKAKASRNFTALLESKYGGNIQTQDLSKKSSLGKI